MKRERPLKKMKSHIAEAKLDRGQCEQNLACSSETLCHSIGVSRANSAGKTKALLSTAVLLLCFISVSFLAGMNWGNEVRAALSWKSPVDQIPIPTEPPVERSQQPSDIPHRTMAGEFHGQSAIILGCDPMMLEHPQPFISLVKELSEHVPLVVLVDSRHQQLLAQAVLSTNGPPTFAVEFLVTPGSIMWVRDCGPQFVKRFGEIPEIVDTDCSYGDEDEDMTLQNMIPLQLGWRFGLSILSTRLRLQGGNFLTNGDGLCVTTTSVLEQNLILGFEEEQIDYLLKSTFGCEKWIPLRPLEGEDTEHIDMFVTFLAENIAIVAACDPKTDPNNALILDEAAIILAAQTTSKGPMQVYRIPMPSALDGVWRSYTNVVFANGKLLVPTYSEVAPAIEKKVFDLYGRLLPNWKIVGINADQLAELGGSLHCVTMNIPDFVRVSPIREGPHKLVSQNMPLESVIEGSMNKRLVHSGNLPIQR